MGENIIWNAHFIYFIQLNMLDQSWDECEANQQGALFYNSFHKWKLELSPMTFIPELWGGKSK